MRKLNSCTRSRHVCLDKFVVTLDKGKIRKNWNDSFLIRRLVKKNLVNFVMHTRLQNLSAYVDLKICSLIYDTLT